MSNNMCVYNQRNKLKEECGDNFEEDMQEQVRENKRHPVLGKEKTCERNSK